MNIIEPAAPVILRKHDHLRETKNSSADLQGRFASNDIILNVSIKDALIRFGIMIILPILALVFDKHLVIYTAPPMTYLFVSAITHFCIIKYLWHHFVKHEASPALKGYGQDPNYPEESI